MISLGLALCLLVLLVLLAILLSTGETHTERLFPITFSIPREKLIQRTVSKTKVLSDLIPGDLSTYIYNTEASYYEEYAKSLFATTTKKGGWDCMRHYEILACGCLPFFPGIEECPKSTMALLPKRLLIESNALFSRLKTKRIEEISSGEMSEYRKLRDRLMAYTSKYLTTDNIARYVLARTRHERARSVLYLSGCAYPDYLRCLTLHGLKTILGAKCHDFPKVAHIYYGDVARDYRGLYGKGFSYTGLLHPSMHDDALDTGIVERIKAREFDIVIYGSYHRGMPHYDIVRNVYKPHEVILLCGEDLHACDYAKHTATGHYVFVREL